MYSTMESIRNEAGFQNADFIEDSLIEQYQEEANGLINSYLKARYETKWVTLSNDSLNLLGYIERLIAAGNLLNKEYWIEDQETFKEGGKKIKQWMNELKKIKNRDLILTDEDGKEVNLAKNSNRTTYKFPKDPAFRIKQTF